MTGHLAGVHTMTETNKKKPARRKTAGKKASRKTQRQNKTSPKKMDAPTNPSAVKQEGVSSAMRHPIQRAAVTATADSGTGGGVLHETGGSSTPIPLSTGSSAATLAERAVAAARESLDNLPETGFPTEDFPEDKALPCHPGKASGPVGRDFSPESGFSEPDQRMVLLVKNPENLHVYWKLSDADKTRHNLDQETDRPLLMIRLQDQEMGQFHDTFIHPETSSADLKTPGPGGSWRACLGYIGIDGLFTVIHKSNPVAIFAPVTGSVEWNTPGGQSGSLRE
jgi:hypothetical protein